MGTATEVLTGGDRLDVTTRLLQRIRQAHPTAGVYEAADLQWWWRRPRRSDDLALPVWFDDVGPAAAAMLVDWGDRWEGVAPVLPGSVDPVDVWRAVTESASTIGVDELDALVMADDATTIDALGQVGFRATGESSGSAWMDASSRRSVPPLPAGLRLVDRTAPDRRRHPMIERNGAEVESRLRQTSLYDPWLDLAVEDQHGQIAGYSLFWSDQATGVGLTEPMRVHEPYRRRGIATSLLLAGADRLAQRGVARLKVGYDTAVGRAVYLGAGFVDGQSALAYRWSAG